MGHKVNPVGMRIGVNRGWNSRWFAEGKEYAVLLNEDRRIREYIEKHLDPEALLSHVDIERVKTEKEGYDVKIAIHVASPGAAIGANGDRLNKIRKDLAGLVNASKIKVDVIPVQVPYLDAQIVATTIARQLEARASFRTAQKKAIQQVRKAGAKGCRTLVSGRLGGADIARGEGYKEGSVPLHTLKYDIDFAMAEARTTYGRLGVKVWIFKGLAKKEKPNEDEGGEQ